MANESAFTMVEAVEPCACCMTGAEEKDSDGGDYGCAERKTVFTHREEAVFKRILANRQRAESVKKRIREIIAKNPDDALGAGFGDARDLEVARGELDALRRERARLEEERLEAADERMRLLGHL